MSRQRQLFSGFCLFAHNLRTLPTKVGTRPSKGGKPLMLSLARHGRVPAFVVLSRGAQVTKHVLVCQVCGKEFTAGRSHRKYCSQRCANKGVVLKCSDLNVPTGTVGAIGELLASVYFLERGYYVFRSVTPNAPCDLIVMRNDKVLRVEVKTGREYVNGRLNYSIRAENAPFVDCVAAVHPDGEVFLFTLDRKPFSLPSDEKESQ